MDIFVVIRFFLWRCTTPSGPELFHYRGFTITLRHIADSSGRVISPTQRHLPDNT